MVSAPIVVDRAGQHLIARAFVDRQGFAGQRAGIDGGASIEDDAVHRNLGPWLDDDAIADLQILGEDAFLLAVLELPAADRKDLDDLADRPLGPVERERFQALAEHADEDDLGCDEPFLDEDRRQERDGDGEIGADLFVEQSVQREVDDAGPAENGRDHGESDAEAESGPQIARAELQERPASPIAEARQQVQREQHRQQPRHQIERQIAFLGESFVGMRNFAVHEKADKRGAGIDFTSPS